MKSQKWAIWY